MHTGFSAVLKLMEAKYSKPNHYYLRSVHRENLILFSKCQLEKAETKSSFRLPSTVRTSQWATLPATLVLLFTTQCLADGETKVYINTVPGYSELVPCAEHPLSTVVRGMSKGRGENADDITSYTCFCTLSSSYMSSVISKAVSSQCRNSSALQQVSSAIAVFDAYCDLGVESGLTVDPLPSSVTQTASPTASSAIPSQTGAAAGTSSSSSDNTRTTAIAAGVAVPVGTIALAVVAYFLYRASRAKRRTQKPGADDDANVQKTGTVAAHMAQGNHGGPHHEVSSDQVTRQEMEVAVYQSPTHAPEILEKDSRPIFADMDASESASNRQGAKMVLLRRSIIVQS